MASTFPTWTICCCFSQGDRMQMEQPGLEPVPLWMLTPLVGLEA